MAAKPQKTILVSSCLLGLNCRYNGLCKKNDSVLNFLSTTGSVIIPVCPEQLAGLPTPRPATEFATGDGDTVLAGAGLLINTDQENMNKLFVKGAQQVLAIAMLNHCTRALLKERSPSCGVHQIYRSNCLVGGHGVTTALLKKNGISVYSEDDIEMLQNSLTAGKE